MSDTNDDDYRVATTFIKPGHENYDACRRLCFQSRVLHNVVVYKLRHDYFAYRNAKAQDPNVNFSKFRISKKDLVRDLRCSFKNRTADHYMEHLSLNGNS